MARPSKTLLIYNCDYGPGGGPEIGEEARAGVLQTARAVEKALSKVPEIELSVAGVESYAELVARMDRDGPFDLAVNIVESLSGDPRGEIEVVLLLEARGVEYTGNTPLGCRQCLDKGTARETLAAAGVPVPAGGVIRDLDDLRRLLPSMPVPAIVKPGREDGSIGIEESSVVRDAAALERRVRYVLDELKNPALVEAFIDGREFNVSVLGDLDPKTLPIAEIDFSGMPSGVPKIVSYKAKWHTETPEYKGTVPVFGSTDEALARRLRKAALDAFRALSLRDYARVDLRVDARGNPYVVDVNPNCDLAPDAGFPKAAAKGGLDYDTLIQTILGFALARRAARAVSTKSKKTSRSPKQKKTRATKTRTRARARTRS